MAKRKLLKEQDRQKLFGIPVDEDSLIRHYSLSAADRLEIELRRRDHNRLGFAIQLCLMRYPGRVGAEETPPRTMLRYVADQIGADHPGFPLYCRRGETRRDHMLHRSCVPVLVPSPERYAIHKLIVASRRHSDANGIAKREKDVYQASLLIEALEKTRREDDLAEVFIEAWRRGDHWHEAIMRGKNFLPLKQREKVSATFRKILESIGEAPE